MSGYTYPSREADPVHTVRTSTSPGPGSEMSSVRSTPKPGLSTQNAVAEVVISCHSIERSGACSTCHECYP